MKTGSEVDNEEMVYVVMYSDNKPTGFDVSSTLLRGFWNNADAVEFSKENKGQVIGVNIS